MAFGQNLPNSGILPLTFADPADYDDIVQGDVLIVSILRHALQAGDAIEVELRGKRRIAA